MTLKKNDLDHYLAQTHQTITAEKYKEILAYFSKEPDDGYEWSEQDICEQIRKMIRKK